MTSKKQYPNIMICGTHGVGKSHLCQQLCSSNSSLKHIDITDLAKQHKYLLDYDDENQCNILDDDAIGDYLDDQYFQKSSSSGLLIDFHSAVIHCPID
ncbi:unnamed protein product [Adineta ricciae]|uniref:Uncharacterized protein n=1 Tax=Adineta ricciae TaxID=249248 RepID=A0A814KDM7_ADIRI|nr:unnamed protein product [Adineta ricciae]